MLGTQHIPLSLGICFGNNLSNDYSSSSSGSAVYRYPEAERCGELAFAAEQAFGRSAPAHRQLIKWTVISACTLLAGLVSTRLPSRLKFVVGVISMIFFFVKCLPRLREAAQGERDAKEAEDQIYSRADQIINEIVVGCSICSLLLFLPSGVFIPSRAGESEPVSYSVNPDLQITQGLLTGLDRFIDGIRIVHGWEQLKDAWRNDNSPTTQFVNSPNDRQRYRVDWVLIGQRFRLDTVVNKIENTRTMIQNTLSNQDPDNVAACRILLGELLNDINYLEQLISQRNTVLQSLIQASG